MQSADMCRSYCFQNMELWRASVKVNARGEGGGGGEERGRRGRQVVVVIGAISFAPRAGASTIRICGDRKNRKKRNSVTLGAGKRTAQHKTAKHARQHRHGAVRHGAEQVDREALVEPAPALKVDDLARGADDAGAFAAAHAAGAARRGQQEPALRLQARAHDFVRVRRHRGRHLCHRGAKEDRMRRNWPVVAMSFWKVGGGYVNDLSRHGQIKGWGAYAR